MRIFEKRFVRFSLLTGIPALLLFSLVVSARAELVVNGGFETGDFTGWTVSDSSGYTNIGPNPLFAHSGDYHANLGAVGILGSLSQDISTSPGGMYDLSFWLTNDSSTPPNEFDVVWDGNTILSLTDSPVFNYTQYSFTVSATSSLTTLQIVYRNDDDFFRLDDVSVSAVPEPSVTWLLLPSLGALWLARSRSRRRV
jgi:hypothetical protein